MVFLLSLSHSLLPAVGQLPRTTHTQLAKPWSLGSPLRPLSWWVFPILPPSRAPVPSPEILEKAPAPAPLPGTSGSFQCLLKVRFTPRPLPGPADSFPASWILLFLSLSQNRHPRPHPYLPTSGGSAEAACQPPLPPAPLPSTI